MTSELTLLVLRLGFLAVLWIFVFSIIYALRSDLFGTRASEYQRRVEAQSRQQTFAASDGAAAPSAPAAPQPAPVVAPSSGASAAPDAPTSMTPRQQPAGAGTSASESASGDAPTRTARLHVTSGPKRGTEVLLGDQPIAIGRAADSDLVIQDDYTSTRHARVLRAGDRWVIQDLDSTNGTYVAGRRVTQATPLQPGTPVRIGATTFELR